jgi:hypothetical protein
MLVKEFDLIPSKFAFADIWRSDEINTNLSPNQLSNVFMEFGRQNYRLDEKRKIIILGHNFAMKANNAKIEVENKFTLEFHHHYHPVYTVYVIIALIIAFRSVGFDRAFGGLLLILLLPIGFVWMAQELVRGIKNVKPPNYGKEAGRIYFEIVGAVREKEKELAEGLEIKPEYIKKAKKIADQDALDVGMVDNFRNRFG